MMVDLNKLAAEIHSAAVEKGFWGVEDAYDKHIAHMLAELGEVVQADRAGIMYEVERDGAKPEGVAAELADFAMMTMDLCTMLKGSFPDVDIRTWNENEQAAENLRTTQTYTLVNGLAQYMMDLIYADDNGPMLQILYAVHEWLRVRGYDLFEIIHKKMEYNKSRPTLHGRAY